MPLNSALFLPGWSEFHHSPSSPSQWQPQGELTPRQTSRWTWRYTFSPLFSPIPPSLPPFVLLLFFLFDTWGGLTSPAAEVWQSGWLGDLKALLGMHCPWVCVCVCCRLRESCVSDKAEPGWPTQTLHKLSKLWPSEGGPSICTARARAHPVGG